MSWWAAEGGDGRRRSGDANLADVTAPVQSGEAMWMPKVYHRLENVLTRARRYCLAWSVMSFVGGVSLAQEVPLRWARTSAPLTEERSLNSQEQTLPRAESAAISELRCNICGGSEFGPGPGFRMSATGKPPRCTQCHSLERHRTLRDLYTQLRGYIDLSGWSALQFSDDSAVLPSWFASHALSVFGGQHTIDIQAIAIPSRQFDCVICNHVLEHVEKDVASIAELLRLVSKRGLAQIGVPDPMRMAVTSDWGFPRQEDHGHYRKYGVDIATKFRGAIRDAFLVQVIWADPVTQMSDKYFIMTCSLDIVSIMRTLSSDVEVEFVDANGATISLQTRDVARKIVARSDQSKLPPPRIHASETLRCPEQFNKYVRDGHHVEVKGWVTDGALSAITHFSAFQRSRNIKGHVCEIGVHHGRYAIALSLLRRLGEKTLAIDVFERQDLNVDQSGKGDYNAFSRNVERWLGPDPDVLAVTSDSLSITSQIIFEKLGGPVRLFSIDGSHTCEHTLNDLRLAEGAITSGGIVVCDDFLNPEWPGVSEAIVRYLDDATRSTRLAPIGYGDNKFYLTTKDAVEAYQSFIASVLHPRLHRFKAGVICGHKVIFFSLPSPQAMLAAPSLETGQRVFVGAHHPGLKYLSYGWHKSDPSGSWSKEEGAIVLTAIPTGISKMTFRLRLAGFVHQSWPRSEVEIWINNELFERYAFNAETPHRIVEIVLDPRDLASDGRVEIWLSNPTAVSPSRLGVSGDKRRLGVFLSSIERLT